MIILFFTKYIYKRVTLIILLLVGRVGLLIGGNSSLNLDKHLFYTLSSLPVWSVIDIIYRHNIYINHIFKSKIMKTKKYEVIKDDSFETPLGFFDLFVKSISSELLFKSDFLLLVLNEILACPPFFFLNGLKARSISLDSFIIDGPSNNSEYVTGFDSSSTFISFSMIAVILVAKLLFPTRIAYFRAKFKYCSDFIIHLLRAKLIKLYWTSKIFPLIHLFLD
ncbi:hypothetical protein AGLY_013255 [Aphis glycines]|uniref:Uncharacterized protein n=1 Tax=Aphis glycines TaxID=307491 RepID=A0A6G0T5Z1_APHGL|nr:hypothetical protein AGLY_013255 [Aphis glycines]